MGSVRVAGRTVSVLLAICCITMFAPGPVVAQSGAQQPVMVGDTEVSWSGDWQYDDASSMETQVTLNQVDPATGSLQLATYGQFPDQTVDSPDAALETFTEAFFQGAGAEGVQEAASGELDNGTIWRLYDFELQGLQLSLIITVSQNDAGEFVVSTLTANTDGFEGSVAQAQEEIMLNGESTFLASIDLLQASSGSSNGEESQGPNRGASSDAMRRLPQPGATEVSGAQSTSAADTGNERGTDGSSRDNPIPVGQVGMVGDYEISVVSVTPNANDVVAAENQFNEPPAPGNQFFMAMVSARYTGEGSGTPAFDLNFQSVGANNSGYTTFNNSCGVVPSDPMYASELFTGGTAEFNVCWQIDATDADSLTMYVEPLVSFDEEPVWFSLER